MPSSKQTHASITSRRDFLERAAATGLALAGTASLLGISARPARAQSPQGGNIPVDQLMAPEALPDVPQVKPADGKEPPVTIVEYASMTCTHCAAFHATTYPVLISKYVDTGKVRFILREFPLDELATAAFMLARCAGADKRNAMVDLLFQQQHNWAFTNKPVEALEGLVRQTGMSHEAFEACLRDKGLRDKVDEVRDRAANKFGVNATPTFFFNGIRHNGELTPEDLDKLLEPMLKG